MHPEGSKIMATGRQAMQDMAWKPPPGGRVLGTIAMFSQFSFFVQLVVNSCRAALDNEALLEELRNEKFDLVLTHYMNNCPLAISSVLGLEKVVWISPGTYIFDQAATTMRIPIAPSYIPNAMTSFTDRMPFMGRVANVALDAFFLIYAMTPGSPVALEEALYQEVVSNQSRQIAPGARSGKTLDDFAAERILTIFINGEEALDYPRPFLPGMMFLGQMEDHAKTKELDETWQALVSSRPDGVIMFSLGTVANTSMMPLEMKEAFLEAFKQFPTYTIIWRLEGQLPAGLEEQKHIKIVHWLPQRDLLHRGNVKLFITHGGYNSLVETAQAGVPMILLPLFGDQQGNAKRAVRHGVALDLDKANIQTSVIVESMRTILNDSRYGQQAAKLAKVMRDKLIANEDAFVKKVETIGRTRPWRTSPARRLGYLQLLCLDVLSVVFLVVSMVAYVFVRVLRRVLRSFRK